MAALLRIAAINRRRSIGESGSSVAFAAQITNGSLDPTVEFCPQQTSLATVKNLPKLR